MDVDSDTNVHMNLVIIFDTALDDLIQLLITAPETERSQILDITPSSEWESLSCGKSAGARGILVMSNTSLRSRRLEQTVHD